MHRRLDGFGDQDRSHQSLVLPTTGSILVYMHAGPVNWGLQLGNVLIVFHILMRVAHLTQSGLPRSVH